MTDFHTHILPGMDDGSASAEDSLEMLRLLSLQGADSVALTPHYYAFRESPAEFLLRRQRSMSALTSAMAGTDGLPSVFPGAEVRYFEGMSSADGIDRLCIGDSHLILTELTASCGSRAAEELARMCDAGFTPVIAHIERLLSEQSGRRLLELLYDLPVLMQSNTDFFASVLTRRRALRMLAAGQIQLLGTDCHNLKSRRPNLHLAREVIRRSSADAWDALALRSEAAMSGRTPAEVIS